MRDLFRKVARSIVFAAQFAFKGRFLFTADILSDGTAGMETTARGNIQGAGKIASEDDTFAAFLHLWVRDRDG